MKLLSEADVSSLLDPDAAIAASAEAYVALSQGRAEIPQRTEILSPENAGVIMVMPGLMRDEVFGLKLVSNRTASGSGEALSVSMVLLFDARTLAPLGLVSSDHFTDYRTAAGLAAATDVLARREARVHALYGAGKLAAPSVQLIARVRPIEKVIVVGRSRERAAALVRSLAEDPALGGCAVKLATSADEAAAEADIITTVTTSDGPVFDGSVVRPGTHINVGGAFRPTSREVDDHIARRGLYFVDSEDSCLVRAGDLVIPLASGALSRDRVRGEIGAVIAGKLAGRDRDDQVTVFKSLGNATQDLVLARQLIEDATCKAGLDFDHRG